MRSAGESRSRGAVCIVGACLASCGRHFAARRWPQRAHLQPRPRNLARDSGTKRQDAGGVCARTRRKIFQIWSEDGMKSVLLLAHGSPESASEAEIREFLNNVTGRRGLP